MKLFLDSANIKEIEELGPNEYVYGLTTNPTFFYEEGIKSKAGNEWNYFTARFVTLRTVQTLRTH